MPELLCIRMGCIEYLQAWRLQQNLAHLRAAGAIPDVLLLLEHPPVITLGRGWRPEHLRVSKDFLEREGIAVHLVDRGGDVTYHGPGQLVGYPIVDLRERGRDVHAYLRDLEEAVIRALAGLGIGARRFPPYTGVWVDLRKIAAIGIRVSRWVATHGFALNVAPSMEHFGYIVPCGIHDYGVTSVSRELGRPVAVDEAVRPITEAMAGVMGAVCREVSLDALAEAAGRAKWQDTALRKVLDTLSARGYTGVPCAASADAPEDAENVLKRASATS